jgi:hypothetical protein
MESVNFVHDVNVLRKTTKSVYANSADLKALNSELGAGPGNCRVQVLPVCWRHLLDFPRKLEKKGERDLGDLDGDEDDCKQYGFSEIGSSLTYTNQQTPRWTTSLLRAWLLPVL